MDARSQVDVWARLIEESWGALDPATARAILRLKFGKGDMQRIKRLSEHASNGSLSTRDKHELDEYLHVGRVLTYMHSHARRAIRGNDRSLSRRKAS